MPMCPCKPRSKPCTKSPEWTYGGWVPLDGFALPTRAGLGLIRRYNRMRAPLRNGPRIS